MNNASTKQISKDIFYLAALGVVMLFVVFVRWRLLSMPLERDEGEYAYAGKLVLDGIAPYKETYNMKLPGTYYMYALMMAIFGKTVIGIHLGLLFVNLLTVLTLFFGFKKLFNSSAAFFASSLYALMSVSPNLQGFAAHATHFVNLFVALGIFLFAKLDVNAKTRNTMLTGLMFGLAFVMKQQAVFFVLFGMLMVFWRARERKISWMNSVIAFFAGAIIPYLLVLLVVYTAGTQEKFWFWTWSYAIKYAAGGSDPKALFEMSFTPMWHEFMLVWLLAAAGLIFVFFAPFSKMQKSFMLFFALFSFLSVCPGFYFRPHYFITSLPAICLLATTCINAILQKLRRVGAGMVVQTLLLLFIAFSAVAKNKDFYLDGTPRELSKTLYGANPFVESGEIGKYIRAHTGVNDKIAVLGSEPELLFYADRHSATGYIYTYSLMEPQPYSLRMQNEMIKEIETMKPELIIFYRVNFSWLIHPDSHLDIMKWAINYTDTYYKLVGVTEVWGIDEYDYEWGNNVENYKPKSTDYILIFKHYK
jgi:hypothetical protein